MARARKPKGSASTGTASADPRAEVVRRIVALAELLEKSDRWDESVRLIERDEGKELELDTREREPSSWLTFSREGHVVEHSCEYSGHNGDSYGHKERVLDPVESLRRLEGLAHMLEGRALAMEERRLEEAAHRHRQELARSNLNARLRGKGIV